MAAEIDIESKFIPLSWDDPAILEIGKEYAYKAYGCNSEGLYGYQDVPITITGKAPSGQYGARVACSDGLNRYQGGMYRGRNRSDNYSKQITYKLNPHYTNSKKPHLQLSLFDIEP